MVIKRSWSFQKQLSPRNWLCSYHSHPCPWSTHPSGEELMDIFTCPACHSKSFSFYFWRVSSQNLPKPKHYKIKSLRGDCFYCLVTVTENEREKATVVLVIHSKDVIIRRRLWPWGLDQSVKLGSDPMAGQIPSRHAILLSHGWCMQATAISDGIFTVISRQMEACSAHAWCWADVLQYGAGSATAQDLPIQPTIWHLSLKDQVYETLVSLQFWYTHSKSTENWVLEIWQKLSYYLHPSTSAERASLLSYPWHGR